MQSPALNVLKVLNVLVLLLSPYPRCTRPTWLRVRILTPSSLLPSSPLYHQISVILAV